MTNWLSSVILMTGLSCMASQVLADTPILPNTQDDPNGTCTSLMQLADNNPPQATGDATTIDNIKTCLASCDQLYQWYATQSQYDEMSEGITYCRNNLSNLYNQNIFLEANNNISASSTSSTTTSATSSSSLNNPGVQQNVQGNLSAPPPEPIAPINNTETQPHKQLPQKQVNWF